MFFKKYTNFTVLLSVFLAIIFGITCPKLFQPLKVIGDIFINLLKLFALPLICTALIAAIGQMGSGISQLKKLAKFTFSYMLLSEVMAVSIALILFNIFLPGQGVSSDLIPLESGATSIAQPTVDLHHFLLSIIPHNIFESLVKFELLPVVIFSIFFGIAAALAGEQGKIISKLALAVRDVTHLCLEGVMRLAPLGIFALVGTGVAQSSQSGHLASDFKALLGFVSLLTLGLFLHGLWQGLLVVLLAKKPPLQVVKRSLPVFSTAFATSSSVATLPVAMKAAEKLDADEGVSKFMLPLCAAINIGGMMMYEVAAVLFFTQVLGIHLSLGDQVMIGLLCILCGMAEGGIPETSLISLVVVFKMMNIPLSALSILLPLDRILDRIRTMVNIFGNMCGVIVVSRGYLKVKKEEGALPTPPNLRESFKNTESAN